MAPLSEEEANYPLAYGMIVYKDLAQLYFIMSSIYHPQNAYCIAVDGKSSTKFKKGVQNLAECLPNVTIIVSPPSIYILKAKSYRMFQQGKPMGWCRRAILESLVDCFQSLTLSNHPWRYYQYFSGFDLPLKTNLEMVRIFKLLNQAVIAKVIFGGRLRPYGRINNDTVLPVRKSSMGALISREAADDAFKNATNYGIVNEVIQVRLIGII